MNTLIQYYSNSDKKISYTKFLDAIPSWIKSSSSSDDKSLPFSSGYAINDKGNQNVSDYGGRNYNGDKYDSNNNSSYYSHGQDERARVDGRSLEKRTDDRDFSYSPRRLNDVKMPSTLKSQLQPTFTNGSMSDEALEKKTKEQRLNYQRLEIIKNRLLDLLSNKVWKVLIL